MRGWAVAVFALLVMGCDKLPQMGAKADGNSATAADPDLPLPGKYESATVAEFTIPGEPMSQVNRTDELCIGSGGKPAVDAALKEEFSPICVSGEIKLKDGDISGQMTCRISELRGAESIVSFSGTYHPKAIDLVLDMSMGQATVRQSRPYRYVGTC